VIYGQHLHVDDTIRERGLCYEPSYDEPFSEHEISEIEAEDESERWVP